MEHFQLNSLFDDPSFVVVHCEYGRHRTKQRGFEIVRKADNTVVFLTGRAADAFQAQIHTWQLATPTQEEVDEALDRFSALGTFPLLIQ